MSDPNVKTKQRQLVFMGGAIVGILGLVAAGMSLFDADPPARRERPKTVSLTPPGTVEDKDVWRANEAARAKLSESNISEIQSKLRAQEEKNKKLEAEMELLKNGKTAAGNSSPSNLNGISTQKNADTNALEKPLPVQANPQRVLNPPTSSPVIEKPGHQQQVATLNMPINGNLRQAAPAETIEMITFGTAGTAQGTTSTSGGNPEVVGFPVNEKATKTQIVKDKEEKKTSIEFIPAGSFVRVAMLNGVDAPTGGQAQSNPLPVAFHVLDTANLANKYKLDIKDCRFIAAAYGDLSSERTIARMETLTCIIDGDTVEIPVKGYAMGEDGKAGIRGRLVTKQGQLLANALLAGSLSGIGKAFQAAATTTTTEGASITQTIDPNKVAQAGIGGGVGTAANMLAQYYLKAADKIFPVIETDGGRIVEVLIQKGAVYTGASRNRDQYRRLLKRNGSIARNNDDD